jgi:hypothetical protein
VITIGWLSNAASATDGGDAGADDRVTATKPATPKQTANDAALLIGVSRSSVLVDKRRGPLSS